MKALVVADGRSPIARNWIAGLTAGGVQVYLASMFNAPRPNGLAGYLFVPAAFSGAASGGEPATAGGWKGRTMRALAPPAVRTVLRHALVPRSLPAAAARLHDWITQVQPDLVHAMRIPYEGMLAALALEGRPERLAVSVWGNDFTLHAGSSRRMAALTRQVMARADGLHTDCRRDWALAQEWGFDAARPWVLLPGGGGVQAEVFYPPAQVVDAPVMINPRGLRAYVRTDTFFRALPAVRRDFPDLEVLCPAMAGQPAAESWVRRLHLAEFVRLLPKLNRAQLADCFRQAGIVLSITTHDGTPNSLLEGLACGCFPIAGDIPAIREWITDGKNGLLVPPDDPQALAAAIRRALGDARLRERALEVNQKLITERARFERVIAQALAFYGRISG